MIGSSGSYRCGRPPEIMTRQRWQARNRTDLIIEVWEKLDCESVGAQELREIQNAIEQCFGSGAVDSPASIARTLADEGAVLRHPEILEADTIWRESLLSTDHLVEIDISNFETVERSLENVAASAASLSAKNHQAFSVTREAVVTARQRALSIAKSQRIQPHIKSEKREIAQWLTVWLQSPEMFPDWLDLRKRSSEFRRRFAKADTPEN